MVIVRLLRGNDCLTENLRNVFPEGAKLIVGGIPQCLDPMPFHALCEVEWRNQNGHLRAPFKQTQKGNGWVNALRETDIEASSPYFPN